MDQANSEVTGGVDTGFVAARKKIQQAAQRAQDRAKEFVSSATTTATRLVEPMQERLKPVQERLKPVQERLKPVQERLKPVQDKLTTVGSDAAANVVNMKARANEMISRARTGALSVADRVQSQTKTAVQTIQANPRVVEAMENPKVAAAVTRVGNMAKSVRETVEPYVRRSLH